jgi:hypothetical protein
VESSADAPGCESRHALFRAANRGDYPQPGAGTLTQQNHDSQIGEREAGANQRLGSQRNRGAVDAPWHPQTTTEQARHPPRLFTIYLFKRVLLSGRICYG